jgi:hypothetical protein
VETWLLELCGEALARPRVPRDYLLVLRHAMEGLNAVFKI